MPDSESPVAPGGGSSPRWDALVREHSARVTRHAYRLTGNRSDAEDLTQDVFVRAFGSLDTVRPESPEGWLHRITTNLFLDRLRRQRRIRFEAFAEGAESRLVSTAAAPDAACSDDALDEDVERALSGLSEDSRVAVVLRDVDELSYAEIAAVLGVGAGTVRSRVHRGRSLLRGELADRAPRPGRTRASGPMDLGLAGG